MPTSNRTGNRVRRERLARGWSQAELARHAGISRAAVSAIEGQRLVPSVAAALAVAGILDCSVEELFLPDGADAPDDNSPAWAWMTQSSRHPETGMRFWCGRVRDRVLLYPVEATPLGELPHDDVVPPGGDRALKPSLRHRADQTLVMAGCDPAAGLLARLYDQLSGYRLLVFSRSSRQALDLLQQGLVHVAGVHLSSGSRTDGNLTSVKQVLAEPVRLLRVAEWEAGVAVGSGMASRSLRSLLKNRLTWVGREPGSGARQCQDQLLGGRPAPRRMARDHRGIAEAVRCGWADAGVCLRLVAHEAGLNFLSVRTEDYDLCFLESHSSDPRIRALIATVQSPSFRKLIGELPGYTSRDAGTVRTTT